VSELAKAIGKAPRLTTVSLLDVPPSICKNLLAGVALNAHIDEVRIVGRLTPVTTTSILKLVGTRQLRRLTLELSPRGMTAFVEGLATLNPPAQMKVLHLLFSDADTRFATQEKIDLDKAFTKLAQSGCKFDLLHLPAELLYIADRTSMRSMVQAFIASRIFRCIKIPKLGGHVLRYQDPALLMPKLTLTSAVNTAMSIQYGAGYMTGTFKGLVNTIGHSSDRVVALMGRELRFALLQELVRLQDVTYKDIRALNCVSKSCSRRAREGRAVDALLLLTSTSMELPLARAYYASIASMLGLTRQEFDVAWKIVSAERAKTKGHWLGGDKAEEYWAMLDSSRGAPKILLREGVEKLADAYKQAAVKIELNEETIRMVVNHAAPAGNVRVEDFVQPEQFDSLPQPFREPDLPGQPQ
jgi:hypothetical protein